MRDYGFGENIANREHLIAIYERLDSRLKIVDFNNGYFIEKVLVLPEDRYQEETRQDQKFLGKKWYTYKNKVFTRVFTELEYKDKVAEITAKQLQKAKAAEKRKKRQEAREAHRNEQGIYGIYIDKELVYIGKTEVSFTKRFEQHKAAMEQGNSLYLYKLLRIAKAKGQKIELIPLITLDSIKTKKSLTSRDIQAMELGLITMYHPRGNVEGVLKDYEFR